jgi:hypothetical protein
MLVGWYERVRKGSRLLTGVFLKVAGYSVVNRCTVYVRVIAACRS